VIAGRAAKLQARLSLNDHRFLKDSDDTPTIRRVEDMLSSIFAKKTWGAGSENVRV
jgi:thymidine phosphorylase